MSDIRTLRLSFNAGEISPEFFGRVDDRKYQTGLAKCLNAIIQPQGPASNRGGSKFVREVTDSTKKTRTIPFAFSVTQTYAMEIGHEYIRFHTMGGTIGPPGTTAWNVANNYVIGDTVEWSGDYYYCLVDNIGITPSVTAFWYLMPSSPVALFEMPTTYLEDDLADLHYTQSNDVMTITHPNYPSRLITRFIPNDALYTPVSFKIADEVFGPSRTAEPANLSAVVNPGSGTTPHTYGVTWIDAVTGEESLLTVTDDVANDLTILANFNDLSWDVVTGASRYRIYRSDGGMFGYIGQTDLLTFKDDGIDPNFLINPPIPTNFDGPEKIANGTFPVDISGWTDNSTGSASISWDAATKRLKLDGVTGIAIADQIITGLVEDAVYNVNIKIDNPNPPTSGIEVYIGTSLGAFDLLSTVNTTGVFKYTFIASGVTTIYVRVKNLTSGVVAYADDISVRLRGNPHEVTYFQQRKVYGATDNDPQKIWMTRPGTENNLSYSIPSRDDDAIIFRPATRKTVVVRHALPLNDLIILTSAAEWKVTSVNSDALTPSSISLKTPSYVGAANVRPVLVNNTAVFVAARGSNWHELAFNLDVGGYLANDLTLRANHLFDNLTFIDLAYSQAPWPIVWGTRSDGRLVGFTYVPRQNVTAFHKHETSTAAGLSLFKHICVIPEGDYDYIYAVVERVINGSTVKYIERFEPHNFDTAEDAFFVDCGATLDSPVTVTGITQANPAVVTAAAHGFGNGDLVDLRDIVSVQNIYPAELTQMDSLNGIRFKIANITANTFELQTDEDTPVNVDTTSYTAYLSGGTAREAITVISSGLDHLEGEEVAILGNGAVLANKTVTGGSITLDSPASIIHVGLPIKTEIETLPLILAVEAAFELGVEKVIDKTWLQVYRSGGVSVGPDAGNLVEIKQRDDEDYGKPPDLITGNMDPTILTPSWNSEGRVLIQQIHPLPLTVLSIVLGVTLGD